MCRLFGFRSVVPSGAHRSLIDAENALANQSTKHPDGWGIGWFMEDDAYLVKSANSAHACERFKRVSSALASHTMVVHVRRATVGNADHLNAHPFRFGRWIMAHNGTIFGFDEGLRDWLVERTQPALLPLILGDTDSEHLFFYLLSVLDKHGACRAGRRQTCAQSAGKWLREALFDLHDEAVSRGFLAPILNVLLTDGRMFLAHRAGMPLHLSTQKLSCADFNTCPEVSKVCMEPTRPEDSPVNHLLVASERIGEENVWEDIADGTTLVLDEDFHLFFLDPPTDWVAPYLPEALRIAS